ncbi:hypothetical protein BH23ACT10_BH23ACT10_03330 [soil metagenome]
MRDVAAIRRWFTGLALLEDLDGADRDLFSDHATWVELAPGEQLHAAAEEGSAVWFLVDGDIVVGSAADDRGAADGVVRRSITTPGYPVGWDGLVWPYRYRWDAVAAGRARLLRVSRTVIADRGVDDEGFAARLGTLILWLAGEQVRRQHTRLVTERYDDEIDAVAALITERATELRVTSALHRIPGYLRSRPTVADAFRALEAVRDGDSAVESELAREALDLLSGVRRELRLYLGLQRVYEVVTTAPDDADPAHVRALSCRALVDLFEQTEHRISGLDRLPPRPGNIVLCNHLRSHPTNHLPNNFGLILDTHFVSSMILYRTYGRAPVRVVRDSHWHEAAHAWYYARLGYVMVPSSEADALPANVRAARRAQFYTEAAAVLRSGVDLVICPEGRTGPTQGSPQQLRTGAFRLAATLDPEPLIVPVAVANFDQRLSRAVPGAVIAQPFRMSDVVDDPTDHAEVAAFVNDDLTPRYRRWVEVAAALG